MRPAPCCAGSAGLFFFPVGGRDCNKSVCHKTRTCCYDTVAVTHHVRIVFHCEFALCICYTSLRLCYSARQVIRIRRTWRGRGAMGRRSHRRGWDRTWGSSCRSCKCPSFLHSGNLGRYFGPLLSYENICGELWYYIESAEIVNEECEKRHVQN